jgi:hypothetical protein
MSATYIKPATSQAPPVEILQLRPVDLGALRAVVRIRVGGIVTIDFCKILSAEDGNEWLALPQTVTRKHGNTGTGFKACIEFEPAVWMHIKDTVITTWREHHAGGGYE